MQVQSNKTKTKWICSLVFNIAIVLMTIAGLIIWGVSESKTEGVKGWEFFKYFTTQSNIVMGVVSLVYIIFLALYKTNKIKLIPKPLELIKLMATTGVVLTFITVFCFLSFVFKWAAMLFLGSCFFYHIATPIVALLTFILFEHSDHKYFLPESITSIAHVIVYGIVYLILGLTHIDSQGKVPEAYDWYHFFEVFTVKWCWCCVIVMFGAAYLIGWLLWLANKKINLFPAKEVKKANKKA